MQAYGSMKKKRARREFRKADTLGKDKKVMVGD